MSAPLPVRVATERKPRDRPQNVPIDTTPRAVQDFSYYVMAQAAGLRTRFLSVWGFPWWYGDEESAPVSGSFSNDFNGDFDGGVDSPTATSFAADFSSDFS